MNERFDTLVNLWYRFTYCRRHGHKHSAFGSPPGEVDDYCLNCGKDRTTVPRSPARLFTHGIVRNPWSTWPENLGFDWTSICSKHLAFDAACLTCRAGEWRSPLARWRDKRWYRTHWYDGQEWHKGKKPSMIQAWDDWEPEVEEHRHDHPSPNAEDD